MLKSLSSTLQRWFARPPELTGARLKAYEEGYEAAKWVSAENPYLEGSALYACWQEGFEDCDRLLRSA
jgi:hypothetical protein